MFNFKNYPELFKFHKKREKLLDNIYKAEARYDNSSKENDNALWDAAIKESTEFTVNIYAKEVFEIFSKIKPNLLDRRSKKVVNWDNVFKVEFNELSNDDKEELVLLIEEYGALHRLPKEFYK